MKSLEVGQSVYTTISGTIAVVMVEQIGHAGGPHMVRVRRMGKTDVGRQFPPMWRSPHELHSIVSDPLSAQVYADFLDENGEPRAAAKLRAAFPLLPGGQP